MRCRRQEGHRPSLDGRTLYGVDTQSPTAKLQALDVASGALRTITDSRVPMLLEENFNFVVRLSLAPDGKAFTTTRRTTARICV